MLIDARELKSEELFIKLKGILASERCRDVSIEILFDTYQEAKRAKAFVSMSGCSTDIEEKDDYYSMQITGSPCCA